MQGGTMMYGLIPPSGWPRSGSCLLYTSPSPRDGHLSIRRQRQMCIREQYWLRTSGKATAGHPYARRDNDVRTYSPLWMAKERLLSLIHISEPTRRTPLYSSAASDVYKRTVLVEDEWKGDRRPSICKEGQ